MDMISENSSDFNMSDGDNQRPEFNVTDDVRFSLNQGSAFESRGLMQSELK